MQEPLEHLSQNARRVHAYLAQGIEHSEKREVIAEKVGLSEGETEDALRELQRAKLAGESMGGWSVLT